MQRFFKKPKIRTTILIYITIAVLVLNFLIIVQNVNMKRKRHYYNYDYSDGYKMSEGSSDLEDDSKLVRNSEQYVDKLEDLRR